MVFGGVHGFKGSYDRNRDGGNFGFQEGFNVGAKLPFLDAGYQFGYEATQSQLSGDANTGVGSYFTQHFYTGGVFHRTRDGFQGGIAWDVLADERDTSVTFSQLRAELGFVDCGCHEVGVTGAVHLKDHRFVETNDNETTTITTFQSVDQFLLYYRMHGERGGEGRIYGGLTDNADGIIGSDFLLPLTDCWSLQPAFTYLIPEHRRQSGRRTPGSLEHQHRPGLALARPRPQLPLQPLPPAVQRGRQRLHDHRQPAVAFVRQLAASSPSSRSVRHFALPPALTNSSSGVAIGS